MGTLDLDPMQAWVRLFNEVIYYFLKLLHKYQNYYIYKSHQTDDWFLEASKVLTYFYKQY